MMKKLLCLFLLLNASMGVINAQEEINVQGNGIDIIGNGTNTTNVPDGTDFGSILNGTSSAEQIFVIQNTGTAPLTINLSFISASSDFIITTTPASPVPIGGSSNIGVTFNAPVTTGTYNAQLIISNSDADEFLYQINITGESIVPAGPEMDVTGNGFPIAGDASNIPATANGTNFGTVNSGTASTEQFFVIQNTGTTPLSLLGSFISGSADFVISTPPAGSVPVAGSTSIGVTFNAPVTPGTYLGTLIMVNNDADENPYQINLSGTSALPTGPEINVQGNGFDIIGDGSNTPLTADGTDFGAVIGGTSSTEQIFVIQNTGTAPLTVNPSFIGASADYVISTPAVSPVPIGGSTNIGITFNAPVTPGTYNSQLIIINGDADESPYVINLTGQSTAVVGAEIDVTGNTIAIIGDGSNTPNGADGTDFGSISAGTSSAEQLFVIENNGTTPLILSGSFISGSADYVISTAAVSPVPVSGSTTIGITFNAPVTPGTYTGILIITNNDADENPYQINLSGESGAAGAPLLITQYYEGTGANDKFIEVKNISGSTVLSGTYHLNLYINDDTNLGNISSNSPIGSVSIGTLGPGQVALYANPSAALPTGANQGSPTIFDNTNNVCVFTGNDVVMISSSNGATSYADRIDIMGVVPTTGSPPIWGANVSFSKGCGTTEIPTTLFDATVNSGTDVDVNDYLRISLTDVDTAIPATNLALGTHELGDAVWTTAWSTNIPDITRNVIINGTYNASSGSFGACNLTINGNLNFSSGTTNYVEVNGDLTISGTFSLGDTESLYMGFEAQNSVITGVITKSETSTSLELYDYGFWSSPVENADIGTVFGATSPSPLYWDQSVANTIPNGGGEALGEWFAATGSMVHGKGYLVYGPSAGTFPQTLSVNFTGKPNNSTITVSGTPDMVYNSNLNTGDDYNFVGNPYPSAIYADEFIDNNTTDIDGTIWFWTHATPNNLNPTGEQYTANDYASYNLVGGVGTGVGDPAPNGGPTPNGTIGSGQGFLVRTLLSSPSVNFNNIMRVKNQTTQFFRGSDTKNAEVVEKDRMWISVESAEGGAADQMLIGFMPNATDDFDRGYDGLKNSAGWISLYSTIDTLKYSIQGLPAFSEEKSVSIGFDTYIDESMEYTIRIDKMEGVLNDNEIYLVDNVLNVVHDLKAEPYTYTIEETIFNKDRFTLQFTKTTLGVDDVDLANNFVVYILDNAFEVRSSHVINELKVYDMMGRLLIDKKPLESKFEINTSSIRKGTVLIIKALFEDGSEANKKAIKY